MIKYEWRDQLSPDEAGELKDLLDGAAEFDAEAEHSAIAFSDVAQAMSRSDESVRHLLIWMLPHAAGTDTAGEPEHIAGIARLVFSSPEAAEATVVIAPRFRAIGILTLLLEQVGLDTAAPGGWLGSGARSITAWARGNHPATGRISNRFLIPRTRRVWKLLRPLEAGAAGGVPDAPTLEPAGRELVLRDGDRDLGTVTLQLDPAKSTVSAEFVPCATIEELVAADGDAATLRRLLNGAAAVAAQNGFAAVTVHTDSDDAALVNACRLSGFQHDRTDVRYELGDCR